MDVRHPFILHGPYVFEHQHRCYRSQNYLNYVIQCLQKSVWVSATQYYTQQTLSSHGSEAWEV